MSCYAKYVCLYRFLSKKYILWVKQIFYISLIKLMLFYNYRLK